MGGLEKGRGIEMVSTSEEILISAIELGGEDES